MEKVFDHSDLMRWGSVLQIAQSRCDMSRAMVMQVGAEIHSMLCSAEKGSDEYFELERLYRFINGYATCMIGADRMLTGIIIDLLSNGDKKTDVETANEVNPSVTKEKKKKRL